MVPPLADRELPSGPRRLKLINDLSVVLDGVRLDAGQILYAGVAPGFGGLYQINVRLPDVIGPSAEIRIGLGSEISPAGLKLPTLP